MLKRVEPYVAWGYPNLKTVKELIYKRGYGKVSCRPCKLAMGSVSNWVCCPSPDGPHRQHAGQATQLSAMAGGPDGNEASLPSTLWGTVIDLDSVGAGQLQSSGHLELSKSLFCLSSLS